MADGEENYEAVGAYCGPLPLLKGERAHLIVYPRTERVLAQFVRVETGYAFGRHDFQLSHFTDVSKVGEE